MADGKALELKEGARIAVVSTVYEEKGKRELKDANGRKVQTRTEDGQRFVQRVLVYPFPAGLVQDPITGKPASELTPQQIGHAVGEWGREIAELKANGGKVVLTNKEGKAVSGTVPIDVIPSVADVFAKGFKLEIQGPVNQQMVKDHVTTIGGTPTKAAAKVRDITQIG